VDGQGRDVGIRQGIHDHRAICAQGGIPCARHIAGVLDPDASKPRELSEPGCDVYPLSHIEAATKAAKAAA
jgi:hypothetical protein